MSGNHDRATKLEVIVVVTHLWQLVVDRNSYEEAIKLFRGSPRWHHVCATVGGAITFPELSN